jgi:lysophospholipase L1-like esterase
MAAYAPRVRSQPLPRSRFGRPIAGGLAVAVILGSAAFAQTHEPEGMSAIDSTPAAADQTAAQRPLADWAGLERYRDEDAARPPASSKLPRVIFLGDSITEAWELADAAVVAGAVLNRGIGGQTTPQMLVRFRQDVINLKPAVVHIMAGTNDIAGNTGPTTLAAIEDNLMSMVELAQANHIRVVLASVPPTADFGWRHGLQPAGKIVALNHWIRSYAARKGLVYVDYYAALVDARQGFKAALSDDGVHPNKAGYAAMNPLAHQAIERAMHGPL